MTDPDLAAVRGKADAAAGRSEEDEPRDAELEGLRRVDKPARVRPLGAVGIERVRCQVARLSEKVWRQEDRAKETDTPCFRHTRHVIFRFITGNRDPRCFYSEPIWAVWSSVLLPVMTQATAAYGYTLPVYPKVMLARLGPGGAIDRHIDRSRDGWGSHPFVHKVHVPLETNRRAVLHVDGEDFHLEAGRAWEVNNLAVHGAFNGGDTDRIHLIFEVFDGGEEASPPEPAFAVG